MRNEINNKSTKTKQFTRGRIKIEETTNIYIIIILYLILYTNCNTGGDFKYN